MTDQKIQGSILVTGTSGFIGQQMIPFLQEKYAGVDIIGLSRNSEVAKIQYGLQYAYTYQEDFKAIFDRHQVSLVIHLAGLAHDTKSEKGSDMYTSINYGLTVELFKTFNASEASKFIYMSSIKAKESNPGPYARSKKMAENYIVTNAKAGKKVFCLRPCLVYGDKPKGNLKALIKFVKKGIPYPFGAYNNKRSYLSIENLNFVVQSIIDKEVKSGVYDLADKDPISTKELFQILGKKYKVRSRVIAVPKQLIKLGADIGTMLKLPFNNESLAKITEELIVDSRPIIEQIGEVFPITTKEGFLKFKE